MSRNGMKQKQRSYFHGFGKSRRLFSVQCKWYFNSGSWIPFWSLDVMEFGCQTEAKAPKKRDFFGFNPKHRKNGDNNARWREKNETRRKKTLKSLGTAADQAKQTLGLFRGFDKISLQWQRQFLACSNLKPQTKKKVLGKKIKEFCITVTGPKLLQEFFDKYFVTDHCPDSRPPDRKFLPLLKNWLNGHGSFFHWGRRGISIESQELLS